MATIQIPIVPVTDALELSQTNSIFVYATYHMECLINMINDTMNNELMNCYGKLSDIRIQAFKAIAIAVQDINVQNMTPQAIIDTFKSKMGNIPLPPSMGSPNTFLKDVASIGIVLEKIASDWITLRGALVASSEQVNRLLNAAIESFKSVYYDNPEYKYTQRLLNILQRYGMHITQEVKLFCQACVVGCNLIESCLAMGLFELLLFVPNTIPMQIINVLRTYLVEVVPTLNNQGIVEFNKELNAILEELRHDTKWCLCNLTAAQQNVSLVIKSVRRTFYALELLLSTIPCVASLKPVLEEGISVLNSALPATAENIKVSLHPYPHDIAEAHDIYDMVTIEKAYFIGKPTKVMYTRWAYNLANVSGFLEKNKMKSSQFYEDAWSLCDAIIKHIQE